MTDVTHAELAADDGSSLIGHIAVGTGAIARTVQEKLRDDQIDPRDFSATAFRPGSTAAENSAAMILALARSAALGGGCVLLPEGSYSVALPSATSWILPERTDIVGAGKGATVITRGDSGTQPWFKATNGVGLNRLQGFTAIGNSEAADYPGTDISGAFLEFRQTALAASRCYAPCFHNIELQNFKADGWIACLQIGNPSYDMIGPRIEGSCSFVSLSTGNCRGPNSLAIPQSVIYLVGNTTPGSVTRLRNSYVGPLRANIPHIKGLVGVYCGAVGTRIHGCLVEGVGTIGIGDNKGGYCIAYVNETEGAPNVDDLEIADVSIERGKSCGIYGANWGGNGGRIRVRDCTVQGLTDTLNGSLPKGAFAATDSNTEIEIDGLSAYQCVAAVDLPLAAGQKVRLDRIKHLNIAASVAPKPETNTGNGIFTLDPLSPTLSGASPGIYEVRVTSAGGATPTFTVFSPTGGTVGTYTVGGAAFATQIKFTIADGPADFIVGDTFLVKVESLLPTAGRRAVGISKQAGHYNTAPSGEVIIGDVYIRDQGSGTKGLTIRGEDASGTLLTYGRISFVGNLDIETPGVCLEMWGENDSDPITPYVDGVFLSGSGLLKSQGAQAVVMRAVASKVVIGGDYTTRRSDNVASLAGPQWLLDYMSDVHIKPASITMIGQGAHASDNMAFEATSSNGTIARGGVTFIHIGSGYRATGLGTAKPTLAPPGGGNGAIVANLVPTVSGGKLIAWWEYSGFQWQVIRVDAATS